MEKRRRERRKFPRYGMEMKIYFHVTYDIRAKVKFKIVASKKKHTLHRYSGLSKNISVEGLGFVSKKKLTEGDLLFLDVYVPRMREPVPMEAEVRWSKKLPRYPRYRSFYHTGVKLVAVKGESVSRSIHYDKKYKIVWSNVLEGIFGSFAQMIEHLEKINKKKKRKS